MLANQNVRDADFILTKPVGQNAALTNNRCKRKDTAMPRPTWKAMVYFAGQNRLADDMVASLKDMKSVGSDDNITLLAQYSAKWLSKKYSSQTELATPLRFHFQANKKMGSQRSR